MGKEVTRRTIFRRVPNVSNRWDKKRRKLVMRRSWQINSSKNSTRHSSAYSITRLSKCFRRWIGRASRGAARTATIIRVTRSGTIADSASRDLGTQCSRETLTIQKNTFCERMQSTTQRPPSSHHQIIMRRQQLGHRKNYRKPTSIALAA